MDPDQLLRHVCDVCDRLMLTYMVVGSTATIAYGEPRFTNDIDIVIDLPVNKVCVFCESFPSADFYVSEDAVRQAVESHFQFNVIHPSSGLKVDFMIPSGSSFDVSQRKRRRQLPVLEDKPVWFASPEDVILKKMVYHKEGGSDKHLRDIAGVLRIQGEGLDREYVDEWARTLQVQEIWQAIMEKESEDRG